MGGSRFISLAVTIAVVAGLAAPASAEEPESYFDDSVTETVAGPRDSEGLDEQWWWLVGERQSVHVHCWNERDDIPVFQVKRSTGWATVAKATLVDTEDWCENDDNPLLAVFQFTLTDLGRPSTRDRSTRLKVRAVNRSGFAFEVAKPVYRAQADLDADYADMLAKDAAQDESNASTDGDADQPVDEEELGPLDSEDIDSGFVWVLGDVQAVRTGCYAPESAADVLQVRRGRTWATVAHAQLFDSARWCEDPDFPLLAVYEFTLHDLGRPSRQDRSHDLRLRFANGDGGYMEWEKSVYRTQADLDADNADSAAAWADTSP